jgi:anti-sigma regulatory factor (Ser/Thr protein kinase)
MDSSANQHLFLTSSMPEVPGLEFSASLKPASLIGGDFYDFQPVEGGLAIMVGDVAGKGIPAAALTALVHTTLKGESQHHAQPADLLSSINHQMYGELDRTETFITAFLGILRTDPIRLDYASAGHTTSLLWRSQQEEVVQFPSTGLPLGISPEIQYTQRQIPLERGDVLWLYSDGITEAENAQGRVFGTQALIDLLMAGYPASLEKQIGIILTALDLHRGEIPLRDDVALFMVRPNLAHSGPQEITPFVYMAEKRSARALALQLRQALQSLIFTSNTVRTNYLNEYELAASEIATNIVVHAYKASPFIGRIQGRICLCADRVTMDIIDSGKALVQPKDPKNLPGTHRKFSFKDPPVSGYGLLIANRLLDKLVYSRLQDERNHWRLEKYLPQGTSLAG